MFTAADITASAPFPRSSLQRFNVARDGTALGWVSVHTTELLNRKVDPAVRIAERLNDLERDQGFDELTAALAEGVTLA